VLWYCHHHNTAIVYTITGDNSGGPLVGSLNDTSRGWYPGHTVDIIQGRERCGCVCLQVDHVAAVAGWHMHLVCCLFCSLWLGTHYQSLAMLMQVFSILAAVLT
jgi:hypothetical protein